ncbi:probable G-protein coupled receptor 148 [Erpetoichthys calabaricus]|uniref:probable G-protein coupled receptor 148 n=1 Tax=Erpetoichthys calabaricus TaxID=27687 RepID=UPI0022341193|nr:probable G-protein coupled receptor 148 [Erpetoichthys calabaricus]
MPSPARIGSFVCTVSRRTNSTFGIEKGANFSNVSYLHAKQLDEFLQEFPSHWEMRILQICPVMCFVAVMLVIPPILVSIFKNPKFRQETRYLLLANLLLCDMMYVALYMFNVCVNAGYASKSKTLCAFILFFLGLSYSAGVLSTKAMVLDTSLAVLLPFRYLALCSNSRTKKVILLMWMFSCIFPSISTFMFWMAQEKNPCLMEVCSLPLILVLTVHSSNSISQYYVASVTCVLLCLVLILCCYVLLYFKTRSSGIWKGFSSRAKGTFLIHYILLFLSSCPLLVLLVEICLYFHDLIAMSTGLWVTLTICNILMVLPKTLSPYLYGFRYREISRSLIAFYRFKWSRSVVSPTM